MQEEVKHYHDFDKDHLVFVGLSSQKEVHITNEMIDDFCEAKMSLMEVVKSQLADDGPKMFWAGVDFKLGINGGASSIYPPKFKVTEQVVPYEDVVAFFSKATPKQDPFADCIDDPEAFGYRGPIS